MTDDLSQLLWGHSSWFHYSNMHRVYKHYHLGLPGDENAGLLLGVGATTKNKCRGVHFLYEDSLTWIFAHCTCSFRRFSLFSFFILTGLMAPTMSFSSYPGMLSSLDDFYSMHETSLAVTQTTNGIYNTSLYDEVTVAAVLYSTMPLVPSESLARLSRNPRQYCTCCCAALTVKCLI